MDFTVTITDAGTGFASAVALPLTDAAQAFIDALGVTIPGVAGVYMDPSDVPEFVATVAPLTVTVR